MDVNSSAKSRKIERKCVDLIVLGIPWKSTEEVVRKYFEQHGEVVLCEVISTILLLFCLVYAAILIPDTRYPPTLRSLVFI